jgi:DNA-binding MarR family transcriptional regulator
MQESDENRRCLGLPIKIHGEFDVSESAMNRGPMDGGASIHTRAFGLDEGVAELASRLVEAVRNQGAASQPSQRAKATTLEFANVLARQRRSRSRHFAPALFGEPAWDMLLDLFVASERRCETSVKSVSIASGVPATTALRWLMVLEDAQLIEREPDPADGRRTLIRLSKTGHERMTEYLVSSAATWS